MGAIQLFALFRARKYTLVMEVFRLGAPKDLTAVVQGLGHGEILAVAQAFTKTLSREGRYVDPAAVVRFFCHQNSAARSINSVDGLVFPVVM